MRGDLDVTTGVVERPLKATVNVADRQPARLIKVRNWAVALSFAVLNDELVAGPEAVKRLRVA
jgi:hypothetical protein